MSIGFGFSVGDFLAALKLTSTVIDALRSSSCSGTQYRELLHELYTLESALLRVKRVELHDSQNAERIALQQAAAQCQRTIDGFWDKAAKYQPHLRTGGSGKRTKDGWMKMKWAVCKKEDLETFKADLRGHTGAIEVLLLTVQMGSIALHARKQEENHKTLMGMVQYVSASWMARLTAVSDNVTTVVQQGRQLIEATAQVLRVNIQVFQAVMDIQRFITRIPPQVDRQQPVYFMDAFGRYSPFHLEFVRSAKALIAVLRANCETHNTNPLKIDLGEFVIVDSGTQKVIDLNRNWDECFFPSQRVAMSIVVLQHRTRNKVCPKCGMKGPDVTEKELEW
ncbi:hypothetical protein BU16DRAFT_594919 [Lophium mytilinum]|uniref:Uncharacterized protein n=1 Tax=Lophium mytilinum TaxID=390894 RepID=A0A6A6QID2_9PEZI|nr:hypothetical protein BU16DRAFT_594919 [Lophium mytilinum]